MRCRCLLHGPHLGHPKSRDHTRQLLEQRAAPTLCSPACVPPHILAGFADSPSGMGCSAAPSFTFIAARRRNRRPCWAVSKSTQEVPISRGCRTANKVAVHVQSVHFHAKEPGIPGEFRAVPAAFLL